MWSVWDKKTDINGRAPERVLETFNHLANEETIFIKTVNGRVTQVEGKGILASVYDIYPYLGDLDFISEYERIVNEPVVGAESV